MSCYVGNISFAQQMEAKKWFNKAWEEDSTSLKIEYYSKAIEVDPKYTNAYNNRGAAYVDLGEYRKAIDDFTKTIKLDPKHASAYNNRGIAYREWGQFQKALDCFNKAIELFPRNEEFYYGRGVVYFELGQYQKARDDFRKTLEFKQYGLWDALAYEKLGEVQKVNRGNIKVISTPSSAKVFLDAGQYMGRTPLTIEDISPGKHKITLVLVDYEKYTEEVEVVAGETIDFSAKLVSTKPKPPAYGSLKVNSSPTKAEVYVNGSFKGSTPLTLNQLKLGAYQLKLSKEGYQDYRDKFYIATTSQYGVSFTLKPILEPVPVYGQLSVDSAPSAQVYLDDKTKGTTPLTINSLEPVTYTLKLTQEGYQDWQLEITIKANQVTRISTNLKKLTPTYGSIRVTSKPEKAKVYVDETFKGLTPLVLENLKPKSYLIEIKMTGYKKFSDVYEIAGNEKIIIEKSLEIETLLPPDEGENIFTGDTF